MRCKYAGPHVVTGPASNRAYTYRRGAQCATSRFPHRLESGLTINDEATIARG